MGLRKNFLLLWHSNLKVETKIWVCCWLSLEAELPPYSRPLEKITYKMEFKYGSSCLVLSITLGSQYNWVQGPLTLISQGQSVSAKRRRYFCSLLSLSLVSKFIPFSLAWWYLIARPTNESGAKRSWNMPACLIAIPRGSWNPALSNF